MMPLSTKLTLLVLALPIGILLFLDLIIVYYNKTSLDLAALLSAILVFLLVWERLRDSLFKKLEYLYKNTLFKLYSDFRSCDFFETQLEIKRLKVDLEKYGKFMNLSIYPKGFLANLNEFLSLHNEFYKRYKKIEELAEGQSSSSDLYRSAIIDYLGLKPHDRSRYNFEGEEWSRKVAQSIETENPELVTETRQFLEKTRRLRREIHDQLEDFLKSNNLELEPTSTIQ